MADLTAETGVPVPTIKYYLREGLLPPGRPLGRNQAEYSQAHVRRLRLVRALIEYGGLSIADIRHLAQHLDDPGFSGGDLLGVAQLAVTAQHEPPSGPGREEAERVVDDLLARHGWHDLDRHPSRQTLIGLVASLTQLGREDMLGVLDDYAAAAERVAEADLRVVGELGDRERALEIVVLGTQLGDTIITALRRLAQAHVSERLHGSSPSGPFPEPPSASTGSGPGQPS
ncbi:MerR family transcriptional regulator [Nonomuraea sp. NPDC047897]|uniref:MerR family transcriptional regulator n=1 Tax=Nonomuraea sp. NPDC047897 TaxID=3364346 RepID=UPI003721B4E3